MKISEVVKKTNVSKETIHYYIREGALPKPKKRVKNSADYDEEFVELVLLIKDLQDHFFLPLSEIKKIIRRQKNHSTIDRINFKFLTRNLRPIDQISLEAISGRDRFMKATGMGDKWLALMEEWNIITPELQNGVPAYSPDNVIIGKMIVDMDRLGFGPRDGYGPENLKLYADLVNDVVLPTHMELLKDHLYLLTSPEHHERGIKLVELTSLFLYHLYRKTIRERIVEIMNAEHPEEGGSSQVTTAEEWKQEGH